MASLAELLRVLPAHEKERLRLASVAQRELLSFYAQAHNDIVAYFESLFPTTAGLQGALPPAQYFEAARMAALQQFIEGRVAVLNEAVSGVMSFAGSQIRDMVMGQITKEAKALGIQQPAFGTPDVAMLERTLGDAVSRIHGWNGQWAANTLEAIRTGVLKGESYRDIAKRVQAAQRAKGPASATAKARAHMLANVRYSVVSASNAARQQAYEGAEKEGIELRKMWWAAIGSCCHSCAQLHGIIVGMNEDFPWRRLNLQIKPYRNRLPHPPLHPNCRCRILPVTAEVFAAIDMEQIEVDKRNRLQTLTRAGI